MDLASIYPKVSHTNKIWVHGHRGSRSSHPENTIPGFKHACDVGAEFFELDVSLTRDDVVVVFHDEKITSRLCRDKSGNVPSQEALVRDLEYSQILEYYCGDVVPEKYPDTQPFPKTHIATLDEVLSWAKNYCPKVGINIEFKVFDHEGKRKFDLKSYVTKVLDIIERHDLWGQVQLQSFSIDLCRQIRTQAKLVGLSCLFYEPCDFPKVARSVGADIIGPDYRLLDATTISACHNIGVAVMPYTVNTEEGWSLLMGMGVDGIITDYPQRLVKYLASYQPK